MVQNQQTQFQQQQPKIGIAALKSVLNNDAIKQKFADMLGKKSQGFITSVINVCSNNAMLANADANSIVLAAANAAALDLPVDPNLGYAAIIPFYDGKKKCNVASLHIQRNGWVELAQRTGKVQNLVNELVYEGDLVSKNRFKDEYIFDETKRTSDKVIGAMAYIKTTNGFEKTVFWTSDECRAHGLRYSQTYKKGYGLWVTNPESMFLKSVIKNLIVKYAPKSIELNDAIVKDQASFSGDINNQKVEYLDNPESETAEVVDFEDVSDENVSEQEDVVQGDAQDNSKVGEEGQIKFE